MLVIDKFVSICMMNIIHTFYKFQLKIIIFWLFIYILDLYFLKIVSFTHNGRTHSGHIVLSLTDEFLRITTSLDSSFPYNLLKFKCNQNYVAYSKNLILSKKYKINLPLSITSVNNSHMKLYLIHLLHFIKFNFI